MPVRLNKSSLFYGLAISVTLSLLPLAPALLTGHAADSYSAMAKSKRKGKFTGKKAAKPAPQPAVPATDASPDEQKVMIEPEILVADDLMRKGEFGDAESLYSQVLKTNPSSLPATVGYGLALAKQFKLEAAKSQFEKAIKMDPDNAMAHTGLAVVMYNSLQSSDPKIRARHDQILDAAIEECKKGLAIDAQMPEAHFTLGNLYRTQDNLDEALASYSEAAQIDPKYSEALSGIGLVKLRQGEYTEAAASFKQAIAANENNSTAHYGLGRTYFKQGKYDEALAELNTSLKLHSESAPGHLTRGKAHAANGDSQEAIKDFKESLRINPGSTDAYLSIASVQENDEEISTAIEQLQSALLVIPDSSTIPLRQAQLNLKLGLLDEAFSKYMEVFQKDPDNEEAAQGIARILYLKHHEDTTGSVSQSDSFESGKLSISKATKQNSKSLHLQLAKLILDAIDNAEVNFEKIGKPQSPQERIAYAEALLATGDYNQSSEVLSQLIKDTRDKKQLLNIADTTLILRDLANSQAAYKKLQEKKDIAIYQKRIKKGLDVIEKSLEIAEKKTKDADALVKKKEYSDAIDLYRSAIEKNPRAPLSRLGLAESLGKVKPQTARDMKEAAKNYNAYVSLSPKMPEKEIKKITKKADSLIARAEKLEQKEKAASKKSAKNEKAKKSKESDKEKNKKDKALLQKQ